jgi:molybdate transport system permease protein
MSQPNVLFSGWTPVSISLWVTLWAGSLALVVSVGLAWLLARHKFWGKSLVELLVMLPLVLPPTVLGYYLLILLGQRGLGAWTDSLLGLRFVFALPGAIIAAGVAALPLATQTIRASLASVNPEIEEAARVDGCSSWCMFWVISLPLAWRGLLAGAILAYLRALGDFGATLMVAGNIPGRTQTVPMAIYDAVQMNNLTLANQYVLLLSVVVGLLLFGVMHLSQAAAPDA